MKNNTIVRLGFLGFMSVVLLLARCGTTSEATVCTASVFDCDEVNRRYQIYSSLLQIGSHWWKMAPDASEESRERIVRLIRNFTEDHSVVDLWKFLSWADIRDVRFDDRNMTQLPAYNEQLKSQRGSDTIDLEIDSVLAGVFIVLRWTFILPESNAGEHSVLSAFDDPRHGSPFGGDLHHGGNPSWPLVFNGKEFDVRPPALRGFGQHMRMYDPAAEMRLFALRYPVRRTPKK